MGDGERALIAEALDYYRDRNLDPGYQDHFEARYCSAFTNMMGGGYADAVATGTAALYVALATLDLPRNGEVIVSPITDPGTLSAIILRGLRPRLADSMPGSYNVGPDQVSAEFSGATACVLVVHNAGQAAPITEIVARAQARGIPVLEDCSQAHGASYAGQRVGTFGAIAAFSAMYRKASIAGPSSGVVYSRDEALYRKALAHADRGKPRWLPGFDDRDPSQFLFPALNLHTDELSCALGIASIERLDETRARRLAFVEAVAKGINARSRLCRIGCWTKADSPFIIPIFVERQKLTVSKFAFAEALRAEGIPLNPHYQYLAVDWPWLKPHLAGAALCPNARAVIDDSFCLYMNENYGSSEARDLILAIEKVEGAFASD
jgi:dTDP-4-amino-4,6-dideoxygalactose transaminase